MPQPIRVADLKQAQALLRKRHQRTFPSVNPMRLLNPAFVDRVSGFFSPQFIFAEPSRYYTHPDEGATLERHNNAAIATRWLDRQMRELLEHLYQETCKGTCSHEVFSENLKRFAESLGVPTTDPIVEAAYAMRAVKLRRVEAKADQLRAELLAGQQHFAALEALEDTRLWVIEWQWMNEATRTDLHRRSRLTGRVAS